MLRALWLSRGAGCASRPVPTYYWRRLQSARTYVTQEGDSGSPNAQTTPEDSGSKVQTTQDADNLPKAQTTQEGNSSPNVQTTQNAKAETPEKRVTRIQKLAMRPPSEALARMAAKIAAKGDSSNAASELDSMRFTAAEIVKDLPKYYANKMRDSMASPADYTDLSKFSLDSTIELLDQIRAKRMAEIQRTFSLDQLKAYLKQHKQKSSGTKKVLVERIVMKVWGITEEAVRDRCEQIERRADADGMTLPLSNEAAEQMTATDPAYFSELEREFNVKIALDTEQKTVRVTGIMHGVRGALSRLREKLANDCMVVMDLEQYGKPRRVSHPYIVKLTNMVNKGYGEDGTLAYFDGAFYARGHARADSLDIQKAIVDAMVEPANTTTFFVEPLLADTPNSATIVPAVDMISKPRTFVPKYVLFAPDHDSLPANVLQSHLLFRRNPASLTAPCEEGTSIVNELREWALASDESGVVPNSMSFSLGKLMFDVDREGDLLFDKLYEPHELLTLIDEKSPLFAFSRHVSPLKWLHSQAAQAETKRQLVLTFQSVPPLENASADDPKAMYKLPVYGATKLVAKLRVGASGIDFGSAQIERIDGERTANVAILQSDHDVQVSVCRRQSVDATDQLIAMLQSVSRRLGSSGESVSQTAPRRHETVDTPWGQFAVVGVELDGVTRRLLASSYAARVHQTWNVVDNQRHSSVELLPSQDFDRQDPHALQHKEWQAFMQYLFARASESATTLGSEV
ncbi:hypothetical protein IW147_002679 [Coemansia sp. RSA 720]|nr:hypothetical protein IW147_002679 [Coemansia sp. RSA 720]